MAQEITTQRQTHTMAIVSAVLAVLGILSVLPLIGPIAAVITGNIARREIAANPAYEGDDLARVGVILGWIGIAVAVLGLIIGILAFMLVLPLAVLDAVTLVTPLAVI